MERIKKYEPLWGKWTIKRIIGEGSFGAVYEVESEKFGNRSSCAVKLISFKNAEMLQGLSDGETLSGKELEQLKIEEARKNVREAVLMEKLQGRDHIVTIYDYDIFPGETTTDVIIRMELLTNLNDYMKQHTTNSESDLKKTVIKLGIDIGKALEDCEEEKIVHRDIKPDNIFVNKNRTFKLGDFGLSRKMNKSASFSLRKSVGTPLYMAPEALGWGRKVDTLSDLYSLGIVMYQLLNGQNIPFVSGTGDFDEVDEAIEKRADGEKILPPEHENGQLWKIIQKTCQFKKENRYQNAIEFRKELERLKIGGKAEEQKEDQKKNNDSDKEEILKELFRMREELERLKAEKSKIESHNIKFEKVVEKQYKVGDTVSFGRYPQDEDGGVKPIEWTVMKKEENKVLLLSKYVLDERPYNKKFEEVTWETSDIRRWLNSDFYTTAFNDIEQSKIANTLVRTENNPEYGTAGGNDTEDKVFLLSIEEVESFFINDGERKAKTTKYAEKACFLMNDERYAWWWLRSPGYCGYSAVGVLNSYGWVIREGFSVDYDGDGVRPALWLNL